MKEKRKQKEPIYALLLITLTFLCLIARLLYIDITRGNLIPQYRDPEINTEFYRGTIYAEDGNILAIDVPTYSIRFSGISIREPARIASLIAPYTELDPLFIERLLKVNKGIEFTIPSSLGSVSRDSFFELIATENLENLISIEKTIEREYPFQRHGEFIIGRTHNGIGISGAERMEESDLKAPLDFDKPISKGKDITLSIDMELQYATETVMEKLLPRRNIYTVLSVIDRNTMELLALDEVPSRNAPEAMDVIEKVLGKPLTLISTDKTDTVPDELPTVLGGAHICSHVTDDYLILSISTSEKFANASTGTLRALLEARNMI